MNRKVIQFTTAVIINSHIAGFIQGTVYKGGLKRICVPSLNCGYCPGAFGSCPLGTIQSSVVSGNYQLLILTAGFLLLLGGVLGRFICGWLCPFGFVQELAYRVPLPKFSPGGYVIKLAGYLKYAVLVLFIFLFPALGLAYLNGSAFCKFVCPVDVLEAYLPLLALHPSFVATAGFLFKWKLILLAGVLLLSMFIFTPFCRFICPLGAVYGLLNPHSLLKFEVDRANCKKCGDCQAYCELGIDIYNNPNSPDCIRCTECFGHCQNRLPRIKAGLDHNKEREIEL